MGNHPRKGGGGAAKRRVLLHSEGYLSHGQSYCIDIIAEVYNGPRSSAGQDEGVHKLGKGCYQSGRNEVRPPSEKQIPLFESGSQAAQSPQEEASKWLEGLSDEQNTHGSLHEEQPSEGRPETAFPESPLLSQLLEQEPKRLLQPSSHQLPTMPPASLGTSELTTPAYSPESSDKSTSSDESSGSATSASHGGAVRTATRRPWRGRS